MMPLPLSGGAGTASLEAGEQGNAAVEGRAGGDVVVMGVREIGGVEQVLYVDVQLHAGADIVENACIHASERWQPGGGGRGADRGALGVLVDEAHAHGQVGEGLKTVPEAVMARRRLWARRTKSLPCNTAFWKATPPETCQLAVTLLVTDSSDDAAQCPRIKLVM